MKKFLGILVALVISFSSFSGLIVVSGASTESTSTARYVMAVKKDVTVYITRTGKKYHRSSCSYLRKSKIAIKLSSAKKRYYTACSRCHPPLK